MVMQKFADWGTEFDMEQVSGNMCWEQFVSYCREPGVDASVMRLRFIGDYVHRNQLVLDFSYGYVSVDGEIYNLTNFPIGNWVGANRGAFRSALYKLCKSTEVFVPNLFNALSIFV